MGGRPGLTDQDVPVSRRSRKRLPQTSLNGEISPESGRSFEGCYDLGDRVKTTQTCHPILRGSYT